MPDRAMARKDSTDRAGGIQYFVAVDRATLEKSSNVPGDVRTSDVNWAPQLAGASFYARVFRKTV